MKVSSYWLVIGILVLLSIGFLVYKTNRENAPSPLYVQDQPETSTMSASQKTLPKPSMQIDQNKQYSAVLETEKGTITIDLNAKETPITVNNFVYLARNGFYDGTPFHRVMKGFMIQGGDPNGDGTGGPGYTFEDEPFTGSYTRGTVAMANRGPDTNGSQFFIMDKDNSSLPKNYVIFGKVSGDMTAFDAIVNASVELNSQGEPSKPVQPVSIGKVTINEK